MMTGNQNQSDAPAPELVLEPEPQQAKPEPRGSYARKRWVLWPIAAGAAVSVWSGWVNLGERAGFGIIHPLPGIWDAFHLNTAITLPIGVEAYGAYALGAWLASDVPQRARRFAGASALGALVLGMAGQGISHLLVADHIGRAPWGVVVAVASIPVIVLGLAATLAHLMRGGSVPIAVPAGSGTGSATAPEPVPAASPMPPGNPVPELPSGSGSRASEPELERPEPEPPAIEPPRQNRNQGERGHAELIKAARAMRAQLIAGGGRATQGAVALGIGKAKKWVNENWAEIEREVA